MKAKEKAKELVDKFDIGEQLPYHSIKHALIAVDEIMNIIPYNKWESEHQMTRGEYWQEVKQEINNL